MWQKVLGIVTMIHMTTVIKHAKQTTVKQQESKASKDRNKRNHNLSNLCENQHLYRLLNERQKS
jgi:uncharacterized membrane protein YjjP (DUF1212 family)